MSFYKIRPRSGTKAQWETANTILAEREIGYELPDGGVGTGVVKMKMGDGVTPWNELPYASYVPDVPNDKGLTEVWNSETSYLANDYVIYDNKVWQALISNNGQTPADGTYWTQVSLKGLNEKYTELNNSLAENVNSLNESMKRRVSKTIVNIKPNETIILNSERIGKYYIIFSRGSAQLTLGAIVGVGYGGTASRHKIHVLIESEITYQPLNDIYGLKVKNNTQENVELIIIK